MISRLLSRGNRVLRPQDASEFYADPSKEFARMSRAGVLLRLSRGYFAVVPEEMRGTQWRPTVESAVLGIAVADYGAGAVSLMGVSAARMLGFLPRAVASAVVAVPKQRPARGLSVGRAVFVARDVATLDLQLVQTELVSGYVTTAEQTALDIAHRPTLGGVGSVTAVETLLGLANQLDWDVIAGLTVAQRKHSAAARLAWVASAVVDPPELPKPRGPVSSLGLRPRGARPPDDSGIVI